MTAPGAPVAEDEISGTVDAGAREAGLVVEGIEGVVVVVGRCRRVTTRRRVITRFADDARGPCLLYTSDAADE